MKAPVVFGIAALGVLAFACAPRVRANDSASRAARAQKDEAPRVESALDVLLGDSREGVRFDFRVTNAGGGKVEMNFPSGQTYDLAVLDSTGREVWRWSKGRMFTQVIQNKILRRADTIAIDERWTGATRGEYVAVARLASANYPIEQRASFVVR